jgi:hypothetical protein
VTVLVGGVAGRVEQEQLTALLDELAAWIARA